ncbi:MULTISPECIES: chemotaxis protein [Massilia]|jgi:two-component system chemotaxis response regulator CheV|uniref:Response regulator n=2 Tax=Massilia TaxID=149698 RepID=A0A7X3G4Z3_9BURK|nr:MULTISPECIES: chemotaxis protein [Telluria group]KQY01001.1 chemotaxis protein CheV [Massilia sp. Root133]KQZ52969.1 chemotaxis protein CheV [Massilia sp. Root1485]MDN4045440.1 chemotaxis protein [Massilia sp. YIM B02787]MVW63776.1 response regulator [Telluria cellulosilytica]
MKSVQQEVDERSNLTGTNKFELLLFRLGGDASGEHSELFGINVFKIREIVAMPTITKVAGAPDHVLGVVNLRGQIIQVLDLPGIAGVTPKTGLNIMLVTEFARTTQAFAVESVEEIVRLDWTQVMSAEKSAGSGMVTSIARLEPVDGQPARLAQVLDVETILRNLNPEAQTENIEQAVGAKMKLKPGAVILAADDSVVARALIEQGLDAMGLPFVMTKSGKECWEQLNHIAAAAEAEGKTVHDKVALVLTDLEMPEMDGFTLTRNIKSNARFGNMPVVIHSSLSGTTNEEHVKNVRADAYVAKFSAEDLSRTLRTLLRQ